MKYQMILSVSTLFLFSIASKAQIDKGQKILSGSISLDVSNTKIDTMGVQKNFNVLFSPSVGKAIKNNLVFGVAIIAGGGSTQSENLLNNSIDKGHQWIAGARVFLNKYYPLGKGFSFIAGVGTGFSHNNYKLESGNSTSQVTTTTTKSNEFHLGANAGLVYSFNKKWMANLNLNNFADFYVRNQNVELKTSTNSKKQAYRQVGFSSLINYSQLFSNMSFGVSYIL